MEDLIETLQSFWKEITAIILMSIIGVFFKHFKAFIAKIACLTIRLTKSPVKCIFETEVTKTLYKIQSELRPNGGSSLRDAINRIDGNITKISDKINTIQASADITSDTLNICRWSADKEGFFNFVNRPFKKLIGAVDDESCLGDSWITNIVYMDDRNTVQSEWNRAVNSKSEYHHSFRVVNINTGEIIKVTNHARVVINDRGDVCGWVGVISRINN